MAQVYILYSKNIDRYYVGSCKNLAIRYQDHLNKKYPNSYTRIADDWEIFFSVDKLTENQARKIEKHIKSMKSRKYFENLKRYPEITEKLINKFR
ncbi:MAG: GIY-YIG nuclease family protein [Flavobacteriales bacterium]|nr:GIY-YIG nuclease family protein [Flavobacteriales bacterium]